MFNPLFFIALGLFGVYTIEFGVVGILPAIIERYRITASQAGLLVGLFALIIALCGPLMVLWLSRFNRKKVLIAALLVFAVASVLSAFAPNIETLMALRVVPALFHPVYFSLAFAAALSLYPPEQSTKTTARAFVGTSMGMVLGVPATTWIASQVSYEASFYFCALVNTVAGLGLALRLPDDHAARQQRSSRDQLGILRKPALWLNIAASTMVFAAMFSVYSYSAEYLTTQVGLDTRQVSALLVVFGMGGVAGNLLAGRLLSGNKVLTTLLHPVTLAIAYVVLSKLSSQLMAPMLLICLFWGAAHTSGLIVTQMWLTAEAPEAPEFATGLYISFINLGVTIGSIAGGWFINHHGLPGTLWSGWLFAGIAFALMIIRVAGMAAASQRRKPEVALRVSDTAA